MSSDRELVDRRGLLLEPEQHATFNADVLTDEQRETLVLLVSFAQQLSCTSSGDAVYLAIRSAARAAQVDEARAARMLRPLLKSAGSAFGPGFL